MMSKVIRYWIPVGLYLYLIFQISSLSHLPGPKIPFISELAHLVEYGILSYLFYRAFVNSGSKFLVRYSRSLAITASILYGFTDELHQAFVPCRCPSIYDLIFDGIGASIAQILRINLIRKGISNKVKSRYKYC
ncbi:MAG: VanZ family protein [bacterium]|nr:VanZ family protein [bacterium]